MLAKLARLYLVALFFFCWGLIAARFEVFPWGPIASLGSEVIAFAKGDPTEDTSLLQKIRNDAGFTPERFLRDYDAAGFAGYEEVPLASVQARRQAPRLKMTPEAPGGLRLVVGAFDFEDAFWGAVLFDEQGQAIHRWPLSSEITALNDTSDLLKNLYGVAFFPNGSAVFNMQEVSGGVIKVDACGQVLWTKAGDYHHVVSPTEDFSAFWTFAGGQDELHPRLLLIDAQNGRTLREIDMADVARANPDIFIFDLQREAEVRHATHPNDISPLPAALAGAFPQFAAGDLAISYHTTNLIFILDPQSLKIKWWYVGAGDGQHDPDWEEDGTISIFNNRWRDERRGVTPASTIVAIDPRAQRHHTLLDGADYGFYSSANGRHEITDAGTLLITSSKQGRVFDDSIVSLVEAGEATGSLNNVLGRLVTNMEAAKEIRSKLASALAYPAFLLILAFCLVLLFLFVLMPKIQGLLSSLGGNLPWTTKLLIASAEWSVSYGWILLLAAAGAVAALVSWRRTDRGRLAFDELVLRLPGLGAFLRDLQILRLTQVLSLLLENGITMVQSLAMSERSLANRAMREKFSEARSKVTEGSTLSNAFKATGYFDGMALDIFTVGENTGNVVPGLKQLARQYSERVDAATKAFLGVVSIGVLLFVFVFVGLVAFGIISAVFQLSSSLSG